MSMASVAVPARQQWVFNGPRSVRSVRSVHIGEAHVHIANDGILFQVVVVEGRSIHRTSELAAWIGGGHAVFVVGFAGYPSTPFGGTAILEGFVFGAVEDIIRSMNAANSDLGRPSHGVDVYIVTIAHDGEQAHLDNIGTRQKRTHTRSHGLRVSKSNGGHDITLVVKRPIGSTSPDLSSIRNAMGIVDSSHV